MLTLFLTLAGLAFADTPPCERMTQVADLDSATSNAYSAFIAMDVATFRAYEAEAQTALRCLDEQLDAAQAARVHRLFAMAAFLSRDEEGALAAFRASRTVDPSGRMPDEIAPEGHPLDRLFERATPMDEVPQALTVPPLSSAYVDGSLSTTRPTTRPAVIQLSQSGGIVVDSRWLTPDDPPPDWSHLGPQGGTPEATTDPAPVSVDIPEPLISSIAVPEPPPEASDSKGQRVVVALLAGAAAAGSAGLYATANSSRAQFDDPATPFEDLEQIRRRTNGLATASGVAAGGAVALGAVAVVARF